MTLTKDQTVSSIQNRLGVSKSTSANLLESVLETIKSSLADADGVLISGFGKFIVRQKTTRRGRNPQTGDDLTLKPRKVVMFKCSTLLKRKINGKGDHIR